MDCACARSGGEPDLGWDEMPVGSGKKENLSDSMALNLFHSLSLCRLGTPGPVRDVRGALGARLGISVGDWVCTLFEALCLLLWGAVEGENNCSRVLLFVVKSN